MISPTDQLRSRALPPFDVAEVGPKSAAAFTATRFASLKASMSVLLGPRDCVDHVIDFVDGVVNLHHLECALPGDSGPIGRDVRVGLTLENYLRFRRGARPLGELCMDGGFIEGHFAALALGEGLTDLPSFRHYFHVPRDETLRYVSAMAARW